MRLILDYQVSQQSKANVAELQTQPLVTARRGLYKNTLRFGIFLKQSHGMLFHASCFL